MINIGVIGQLSTQLTFPSTRNSSGGGGGGAATMIFNIAAHGTPGGCTTTGINTATSTIFIAGVHGYRSPYPLASSSPSNTWTALTGLGNSGAGAIIYYVLSPTTGGSQTFSADGGDVGTQFSDIAAIGFSGITAYDASSAGNILTGNTIQPGSLTPAVSGEVFITMVAYDFVTETMSIDSGFTIIAQGLNSGGTGFAVAYKIKTDALAENPTWTATGDANPALTCIMSAFKP